MARPPSTVLPVIPHTSGSVLLPGIIQRLPVSSTGTRADIPAILANIYTRAASRGPNERIDTVPVACVPVKAPFLPDGHILTEHGVSSTSPLGKPDDGRPITKNDLFVYGVAAKILGIEGSGSGEFYLRIEGTCRVGVEKVTQERPFFEAKVQYFPDKSTLPSLVAQLCVV